MKQKLKDHKIFTLLQTEGIDINEIAQIENSSDVLSLAADLLLSNESITPQDNLFLDFNDDSFNEDTYDEESFNEESYPHYYNLPEFEDELFDDDDKYTEIDLSHFLLGDN